LSPDLVPLWIQILSGLRLDSDPVWMASGFWNESRFRSFKDSIRTCLGCHLNSSTDRTAHRCRDRLQFWCQMPQWFVQRGCGSLSVTPMMFFSSSPLIQSLCICIIQPKDLI